MAAESIGTPWAAVWEENVWADTVWEGGTGGGGGAPGASDGFGRRRTAMLVRKNADWVNRRAG